MKRPGKMLREVLNHLLKKPATKKYPYEPIKLPDGFRGRLRFYPERCVGCKLCMKDCPADAIIIEKIGDTFEAIVDLDKCIYCGQCVLSCNKNALEMTKQFELAQIDKRTLKVKI